MPFATNRGPSPASDAQLRVLVIGGGGRDHALCHAIATSPRLAELHAAPGNAGMADLATCHPHVALDDYDAMLAVARDMAADLVIIGAEDLLVDGLASRFADAGFTCLGPSREAAQLEGSKVFSKQLMEAAGVPTPPWRRCDDVASAHRAIEELGGAVAVKADGLAAGCGAFVCPTVELAHAAVHELMVDRRFGASGATVIVEQLVDGEEASVMALVDGERIVPLPAARDYKRLGTGDRGPNTGGMGAHAPSTDVDEDAAAALARATIQPVIDQLREAGTPFRGVVYAGVMLTSDGPRVLEYNCRFGNPETQALVRVLGDVDLLDLLQRAATGRLEGVDDVRSNGAAVSVCVAAEHYPELQLEPAPVLVTGLDAAGQVPGVELFIGLASRTASGASDELLALGGRVVTVSAWGTDFTEAIERAYEAAEQIQVAGRQLRRDIGEPALAALAPR
jgi:phosphoribosylamine--glycine ligase